MNIQTTSSAPSESSVGTCPTVIQITIVESWPVTLKHYSFNVSGAFGKVNSPLYRFIFDQEVHDLVRIIVLDINSKMCL